MARAAWLALFLLLPFAAQASAQAPSILPEESPYRDQLFAVDLVVETPPQDIPLLGQAQYILRVRDLSADRSDQQGLAHQVLLSLTFNQSQPAQGWNAFLSGPTFFATTGGDEATTAVTIQAPATAQGQFFRVEVRAVLQSQTGQSVEDLEEIVARLAPFSRAFVDIRAAPADAGPFEQVEFPVTVGNVGQYPDTYLISAVGPPGWLVTSAIPRLTLWPGETRDVAINVITPADRVFVPQETGVITVQVRSEADPNVVYERAAVIILEGVFLPDYWLPIVVLGAVLAGAVGRQAMEGSRRRAKEMGKPVPPRLTPAQEVLLADMKRRDPERYRAFVRRQRAVFRTRQRIFSSVRTRRSAIERALVARQHEQARGSKAEEKQRERLKEQRLRELEKRKAAVEAEKARIDKAEERRERDLERARAREAARQERLVAPERRRRELERKKRLLERRAKGRQRAERPGRPPKAKRGRKGRGKGDEEGAGGGEGPPPGSEE